MTNTAIAAALTLVLSGFAQAQSLPDSIARRVDQVFAAYDGADRPGCAVGVYQGDRIAYARGYGMANLELGTPLTPKSFLDIGSTSKQFTAFAVGLLEQDGKLLRTDPVRKYLPELGRYADGITVEQLIQHTSGLRDYLVLMSLAGFRTEDWTDAADALRLVVRQRAANFAPDAEYLYSNTGYFLLAQIVERVSGRTLRSFAEDRIFRPLAMSGTHFHDDHGMIVPNRATGYSPRSDGHFAIDMSDYEQTGDGAVQTSIEELLRWDANFYSGQVGGLDLVRQQQVPGTLVGGQTIEYAGGLMIGTFRGQPTVRHGGSWAGYRAELLRFPSQHTSMAVLCNRADADPSGLADRMAEVVLAGVLESPKGAAAASPAVAAAVVLSPEALAARVGIWRGRKSGEERVIALVAGQLVFKIGGDLPLVPISADRFSLMGSYSIRFETEQGRPVLIPEQPELGDEKYDLIPPYQPGAAQLRALAGKYYADELGVTWQVRADSGGLKVEDFRGRELTRLTPSSADVFGSTLGIGVRFLRGADRRVTGLSVQAGRVRNILFSRAR